MGDPLMAIAFYSSCGCNPPRSGAVSRLHILREVPRRATYRGPTQFRSPDMQVGWCGTGTWGHRHDITPLPAEPPAGLAWCGACVGRYADHTGQLNALAAQLSDRSTA
jgi:hypothetical protein